MSISLTKSHLVRIVDQILLIFSIVLLGLYLWNTFVDHSFQFFYDELYTILWLAFLVEFVIKLSRAHDRLYFLLENILLVVIILFPFLRVLELFPLSRWSLVIFAQAVYDRFPTFRKYRALEILLISTVLVVLSADVFLKIENQEGTLFKSFGDAVWFAVVTVATVGYGDIYPKTTIGRYLAGFLIIFGVSIFGIITASISSYLVERDIKKDREQDRKELKNIKSGEQTIEEKLEELLKEERHIENRIKDLQKQLTRK